MFCNIAIDFSKIIIHGLQSVQFGAGLVYLDVVSWGDSTEGVLVLYLTSFCKNLLNTVKTSSQPVKVNLIVETKALKCQTVFLMLTRDQWQLSLEDVHLNTNTSSQVSVFLLLLKVNTRTESV